MVYHNANINETRSFAPKTRLESYCAARSRPHFSTFVDLNAGVGQHCELWSGSTAEYKLAVGSGCLFMAVLGPTATLLTA